MQLTGNTILITGGGSGIGRALAEAFHTLGNQVIIAGRRKDVLAEVTATNAGMKSAVLDIENAESIPTFAEQIRRDFPGLDAVIHSAGIMKLESLKSGALDVAETTLTTNLLGPIRLTAALLPLLISQARATIITVSSGLAFLPRTAAPTYCATKAAIHSYSQSLRHQLKDTSVQVLEIIPPYVQTALMSPQQASDPHAMPLKEFISETMFILETSPDANEICVERVKPLRFAEVNGSYDMMFSKLNDV